MVPAKQFLEMTTPLILDVRSPSEFGKGHIPGAVSFPLFSDEERARVGTAYKQQGPDEAMLLGLEFVGPKMAEFVRQANRLNPRKEPMRMYCFRGGQRSQSLAWLLQKGGFEITLLEGGYKAYRAEAVRSFLEPQKIVVLSGCTGAGKTRILHALKKRGEQIVDLEDLACHKGSAFGGYHQPAGLTTEMFHNLLHQAWANLDRKRTTWFEDEGRTLGKLLVPDEVWMQMREAPVIFLDIPQEERVKLLVEEYADYDDQLLRESLDRITKRLGGLTHRECIEALNEKRYDEVARRCLDYYDKAYRHCVEKRNPEPYWELPLDGVETETNVKALLEFYQDKVSPSLSYA
ncbi:MAG: tRNA 2-selenouridine(34) synthase MnmH [Candidatus Eremiobacteraeota bacterium]|nr:tRNA 2-selenouridine(34) synthase MnmH [Candidatus Eremiobacteraeota bacterium]